MTLSTFIEWASAAFAVWATTSIIVGGLAWWLQHRRRQHG